MVKSSEGESSDIKRTDRSCTEDGLVVRVKREDYLDQWDLYPETRLPSPTGVRRE